MWHKRLQDNYDGSFEQWKSYAEIYGLHTRLGFATIDDAWNANPPIKGSANPQEFSIDIDKLDPFTEAYIECALWSSTDDNEESLDGNFCEDDISAETLATMVGDCADFQQSQAESLAKAYCQGYGYDAGMAGHDFWLTRNGHGAGFWDRGLGDIGEALTKASKVYGSHDLYVADEQIHG